MLTRETELAKENRSPRLHDKGHLGGGIGTALCPQFWVTSQDIRASIAPTRGKRGKG